MCTHWLHIKSHMSNSEDFGGDHGYDCLCVTVTVRRQIVFEKRLKAARQQTAETAACESSVFSRWGFSVKETHILTLVGNENNSYVYCVYQIKCCISIAGPLLGYLTQREAPHVSTDRPICLAQATCATKALWSQVAQITSEFGCCEWISAHF